MPCRGRQPARRVLIVQKPRGTANGCVKDCVPSVRGPGPPQRNPAGARASTDSCRNSTTPAASRTGTTMPHHMHSLQPSRTGLNATVPHRPSSKKQRARERCVTRRAFPQSVAACPPVATICTLANGALPDSGTNSGNVHGHFRAGCSSAKVLPERATSPPPPGTVHVLYSAPAEQATPVREHCAGRHHLAAAHRHDVVSLRRRSAPEVPEPVG